MKPKPFKERQQNFPVTQRPRTPNSNDFQKLPSSRPNFKPPTKDIKKTLISKTKSKINRDQFIKNNKLIAQTAPIKQYIEYFPEAAAPEGFEGPDPEEGNIKNNLIELKKLTPGR